MKTLVKNEFRQTRKTLLIWLGIMLLLCGFCYFELLSLKDSLDEMARTVGPVSYTHLFCPLILCWRPH